MTLFNTLSSRSVGLLLTNKEFIAEERKDNLNLKLVLFLTPSL